MRLTIKLLFLIFTIFSTIGEGNASTVANNYDYTTTHNVTSISKNSGAFSPINVGDFIFAAKGLFNLAVRAIGARAMGEAARGGMQYTKSSLQIGQKMHKVYKSDLVDKVTTFKEFGKVKGVRPDFVDFSTRTIYELKPYNPRGIQQGWNQLYKYQNAFQQKYGGEWKIVLDLY